MTRANKKNVERMKEYVVSALQGSGYHLDSEPDQETIRVASLAGDKAYDVFLHYQTEQVQEWAHKLHQAIYGGRNVANIFYKETRKQEKPIFFRPIREESLAKRQNKSFKNYTWNQLKHLIHLREREKEVLRLQGDKRLVYFEPSNFESGGRITESLTSFDFLAPSKDYSHIDDERRDFVANESGTQFQDYMFSGNKRKFNTDIEFKPTRSGSKLFTLEGRLFTPADLQREREQEFLAQTGTTREEWGGDLQLMIDGGN